MCHTQLFVMSKPSMSSEVLLHTTFYLQDKICVREYMNKTLISFDFVFLTLII